MGLKQIGIDLRTVELIFREIEILEQHMRETKEKFGFCTKESIEEMNEKLVIFKQKIDERIKRKLSCGQYVTYYKLCPNPWGCWERRSRKRCHKCNPPTREYEKEYYPDNLYHKFELLEWFKEQDGRIIGRTFGFNQIMQMIREEKIAIEVGLVALEVERERYGYYMMIVLPKEMKMARE